MQYILMGKNNTMRINGETTVYVYLSNWDMASLEP